MGVFTLETGNRCRYVVASPGIKKTSVFALETDVFTLKTGNRCSYVEIQKEGVFMLETDVFTKTRETGVAILLTPLGLNRRACLR